MAEALPLDSDWLRENPLPRPDDGADKNARGKVLAIGGCRFVPGGILLTAEAALRAGAGKVQIATIESAAIPVGIAMPEVGVIALSEHDGEIAGDGFVEGLQRCDAVIAGPAMGCATAAGALADGLLATPCDAALVLDAAALMSATHRKEIIAARRSPAVLTPHIGEMAAMLGCGSEVIEADRDAATMRAASEYGAIVVLKGPTSLVAEPGGRLFAYAGGGVGLATGGSGDVLAGIVAGLAARGADPLTATLWAVWLHGEAGRRCSEQMGPLGFMARELLAHVPGLMRAF